MTAITIRQGRPGDAAAITRMVQQLAEATVAGFVPKLTPEIYRTEAFGPHPQLIVWIALDVDAPVGMLLGNPVTSSWRGKRGLYVGDLYVATSHRGKGIGQSLLREALRQGNFGFMKLEVAHANAAGQRFYQKLGFHPSGYEQNWFLEPDATEAFVADPE